VGGLYILIAADGLIDIARGELVQLLVVAENDDSDVDRTKNRELMSLLEQTAFALQKRAGRGQYRRTACALFYLHGAVPVVLDGFDLNLPATHGERNKNSVTSQRAWEFGGLAIGVAGDSTRGPTKEGQKKV
jgi:hypothetical protein